MRTEKATFTNMCMIYDGTKILVQDRKNKNWPGVTFPGGHVEKEESFVDAMIREVYEETGLTIDNLELCGLKQFTTEKDGRYTVLLYKTNTYSGEIVSSDEGDIFWIEKEDLINYKLSGDFLEMIKVFDREYSEFFYRHEGETWQYELK